MRKINSDFETKWISEEGSQFRNKDYFGFVEMDNYACWVIAEGYDNDLENESAKLAVDTVVEQFTKKPTLNKRKLGAYIKEAHRQLIEKSVRFQLKASIMLVVSDYKRIRYALCGNCRLNIFRGSKIFFRSQDQSLYQEIIDKEKGIEEQESALEESRNLFDYLGKPGSINVTVSNKMILQDEDVVLLSTWGLWEKLSTIEMLDCLDGAKDAQQHVDTIQDLFLSKQGPEVNSFSVCSVFVKKVFVEKDNKKFWIKVAVIVGVIVLVILLVILFFNIRNNNRRNERISTLNEYEERGDMYIGDENFERALAEYAKSMEESDKLKETKGAKGKENEEIKDRLSIKQKYTEYMIEGYALLDSGDYVGAMKAFQRALKEAKYDAEFSELIDIDALEALITYCEDYELIKQYLEFAELKLELGDYEGALTDCTEARSLARQHKDRLKEMEALSILNDINARIDEQKEQNAQEEAAKAEEEKSEKVDAAQEFELEAEKALLEKEYDLARSFFAQAIEYYTELGETASILEVEKKIIEIGLSEEQDAQDDLMVIAADYMLSGDSYQAAQRFSAAVEYYNYAKNIYVELNNTEMIVVINNKIKEANDAKKAQEDNIKTLEIEELVNEGDRYVLDYQYSYAIENYKKAKMLYQGINNIDMVLEMERRIRNAEELRDEARQRAQEAAEQEATEQEAVG